MGVQGALWSHCLWEEGRSLGSQVVDELELKDSNGREAFLPGKGALTMAGWLGWTDF